MDDSGNEEGSRKSRWAIWTGRVLFAFALMLAGLVPVVLWLSAELRATGQDQASGQDLVTWGLKLGEWGDFLAGSFGVAALLVLGATFLIQYSQLSVQQSEIEGNAKVTALQTRLLLAQCRNMEWDSTRQDAAVLAWFFVTNIFAEAQKIWPQHTIWPVDKENAVPWLDRVNEEYHEALLNMLKSLPDEQKNILRKTALKYNNRIDLFNEGLDFAEENNKRSDLLKQTSEKGVYDLLKKFLLTS